MTICIAAKITRADGTVITRTASDSEVSFGNRRLRGISKSCEKVIQFNGASVSASGSGCVFEALLRLKNDKKYANSIQFRTRDDIVNFSLDFYEEFNNLINSSGISKEDASIGNILITTDTQVFAVFQDFSIFEFDEYFCTGSGSDTATGLMIAYYKKLGANPSEEDLEWVLKEVIEETCALEMGCGLPLMIYKPLAPNPLLIKKPKKKKKKLTNKEDSSKITSSDEGVTKSANNKRRAK